MPPLPKPAELRQHRHKSTTARKLAVVDSPNVPELPDRREWDSATREWWHDIWSSPMGPEYDDSDLHGLISLAVLIDDFNKADDPNLRVKLSSEIRLQRQCFGLTPIDRRRLQWEIVRTDDAVEKRETRKRIQAKTRAKETGPDPRSLLG